LFFQVVVRQPHVQASQVRIVEQLAHEVRRARVFRPDPDRDLAKLVEAAEGAVPLSKQQQRLGLGKLPKHDQSCCRGHRRAILHEGECRATACVPLGQATDILD
jgi:hypothetical protein